MLHRLTMPVIVLACAALGPSVANAGQPMQGAENQFQEGWQSRRNEATQDSGLVKDVNDQVDEARAGLEPKQEGWQSQRTDQPGGDIQ